MNILSSPQEEEFWSDDDLLKMLDDPPVGFDATDGIEALHCSTDFDDLEDALAGGVDASAIVGADPLDGYFTSVLLPALTPLESEQVETW